MDFRCPCEQSLSSWNGRSSMARQWLACIESLKHLSTKHHVQFFLEPCIALLTMHHRILYVCLCHLSDYRSQRMLVWWVQMSGWAGVYPSGVCVWQTAWLQWLQWWNELWWVRLHPHLSQKIVALLSFNWLTPTKCTLISCIKFVFYILNITFSEKYFVLFYFMAVKHITLIHCIGYIYIFFFSICK